MNGATPVSISYSTTPSAYTSERPSSAKPCACSGEKYVAVPSTAPVFVSGSLASARAIPKSVTFTCPCGVMSTLPGFTSRCTTPLRVRERQRVGDLGGDARGVDRRERAVGVDHLAQRLAGHVLHHDEGRAVLLAPVVDRDDVRVVQAGGRLRLAAEPLDVGRVGRERGASTFTATRRSSSRSCARNTSAMPPWPISSPSS